MPNSRSHLLEANGIFALKSTHPEVRRLKRQGNIAELHGNKVWRSSFVLMDYFLTNPIPQGCRVMDVGCGWGLTGIFLNRQFDAVVTGIDADENVEPFLDLQCEVNGAHVAFEKRRFEQLTMQRLAPYHTLVGADICFWDEMAKPLFNLINRALRAGVQQVVVADPGRAPFFALAELCSQSLDSEIIVRSIDHPMKTRKHILLVENRR